MHPRRRSLMKNKDRKASGLPTASADILGRPVSDILLSRRKTLVPEKQKAAQGRVASVQLLSLHIEETFKDGLRYRRHRRGTPAGKDAP
jgi:hypothetical protein